jgi:hypothetical protein
MHDMIARVMDLHFAIFERLALIFLVNIPWLAALALAAIWNISARGMRGRANHRNEPASIS